MRGSASVQGQPQGPHIDRQLSRVERTSLRYACATASILVALNGGDREPTCQFRGCASHSEMAENWAFGRRAFEEGLLGPTQVTIAADARTSVGRSPIPLGS